MIPAATLPRIVRTDVIPMASASLLIGALLLFYWRSRRLPVVEAPPRVGGLLRHIVVTAGGGYIAFMAIVVLTSPAVARPAALIREAAWGGAFLAGAAVVAFVLLSWVQSWRTRRSLRG